MNNDISNCIDIWFSSDIKKCQEILANKDKLKEESKKIFQVTDTNKDGLIDFNEFSVLIKEIEKKSCKSQEEIDRFERDYLTPDMVRKTFVTFDTNKDDRIDLVEFQEIFADLMHANLIAHSENPIDLMGD